MPMNNIEYANYNQTTIPCKYCPSEVKRSRLSFHVSKCHKDELMKERTCGKEVVVEFPDTPSLVPERPICHIVPNDDTENWDDSNYPSYNPLIATADKPIIRYEYYHGSNKEEKRKCQEFERARMAQIRGRISENLETSYESEVFVPIPQHASGHDGDTSEETWSESSLSAHSMRSEVNEDSFNTCLSGDTSTPTHENIYSVESSMLEYIRHLSDEKRADVMRKFTKIMSEH